MARRAFVNTRGIARILTVVLISVPVLNVQAEENDAAVKKESLLTIGSPAPPLHVEHWVQNGEGRFQPVTKFEPGKVYVVEFWATWCGPCIASMPHIAELQRKYADKDVQIVSISDEELSTVKEFLKREAPGQGGKTFGEITKGYCLTTDPDQSSQNDYMRAARQNGIPTAFIVGKQGLIEWIGHPMSMEEPLEQVVAGTWDRDAFAVAFGESQRQQLVMEQLSTLLRSGKTAEALSVVDDALAKAKTDESKLQWKTIKLQILPNVPGDHSEAFTSLIQEILQEKSDDANLVNFVARFTYLGVERKMLSDLAVVDSVVEAVEKLIPTLDAEVQPILMDAAARLHFKAGRLEKAIDLQRKAVAGTKGADREAMSAFLRRLEEEAKKADSDNKK